MMIRYGWILVRSMMNRYRIYKQPLKIAKGTLEKTGDGETRGDPG
jgi:hypothetical protein